MYPLFNKKMPEEEHKFLCTLSKKNILNSKLFELKPSDFKKGKGLPWLSESSKHKGMMRIKSTARATDAFLVFGSSDAEIYSERFIPLFENIGALFLNSMPDTTNWNPEEDENSFSKHLFNILTIFNQFLKDIFVLKIAALLDNKYSDKGLKHLFRISTHQSDLFDFLVESKDPKISTYLFTYNVQASFDH